MASDASPPPYINPSFTDLPPYTERHRDGETTLDSQPLPRHRLPVAYEYHTKRLSLNLGRRFSTHAPAYGRHGVINGSLTVKDFKYAEKITLTVVGSVENSLLDRGFPVQQDLRIILLHEETLWTASEGGSRPNEPRTFNISYPLPSYTRGRNTLLPPSTSILFPYLQSEVRYRLKVDMYRKGLHRHERVMAQFFYLPRSTPASARNVVPSMSEMTAKDGELNPATSRTVEIRSVRESEGICALLSLPRPLIYVARVPIPFIINILSSEAVNADVLLQNLSVTLVKATVITCEGYRARFDRVVGTGTIWSVDVNEGDGGCIIHGSLSAGNREGGEASWGVEGLVEVKYEIKVQIRESETTHMAFVHYEEVQMTTHEELEFDTADRPALGLIGRTE